MAGFMRGTIKNLEAYVTEISRAAADLSTGKCSERINCNCRNSRSISRQAF